MSVCLAEDDYTRELETDRGEALWKAELSDGSVVTMDDGRPGASPRQAWLRLAGHCRAGGLSVRNLWLKFRSNERRDILPAGADAYFFCKSALGQLNTDYTLTYYLVGALRDGALVVQRWSVPELILVEAFERDPARAGECLIWNRHDAEKRAGEG